MTHNSRLHILRYKKSNVLSLSLYIDLGNPPLELAPSRHKVEIVRDGVLNGILIYFELDLGTEELFSTHPTLATPGNHWASKVWVPGEPVAVRRGDELEYHCNGSEGSSFKLHVKRRESGNG